MTAAAVAKEGRAGGPGLSVRLVARLLEVAARIAGSTGCARSTCGPRGPCSPCPWALPTSTQPKSAAGRGRQGELVRAERSELRSSRLDGRRVAELSDPELVDAAVTRSTPPGPGPAAIGARRRGRPLAAARSWRRRRAKRAALDYVKNVFTRRKTRQGDSTVVARHVLSRPRRQASAAPPVFGLCASPGAGGDAALAVGHLVWPDARRRCDGRAAPGAARDRRGNVAWPAGTRREAREVSVRCAARGGPRDEAVRG
jgi:hypothetical protein